MSLSQIVDMVPASVGIHVLWLRGLRDCVRQMASVVPATPHQIVAVRRVGCAAPRAPPMGLQATVRKMESVFKGQPDRRVVRSVRLHVLR